jgi:hypothetical protein
MAQVRQGIALLESLMCDDNAYLDPPTTGTTGTNAVGARDTTALSPNQPLVNGRNLVWAVPPAAWDGTGQGWGTHANPISGYEQLVGREAATLDGDFYEIVTPDSTDPDRTLGTRGWSGPFGGTIGGYWDYTPGGWQVGQFGNQTIRIKQGGWYYFALNVPFTAGPGASDFRQGSSTSVGNHIIANDCIRVHAQLWVNSSAGSTDTFGSDWMDGGHLGIPDAGSWNYVPLDKHKKYGNAQYSTCVELQAGDLVQIRVKGLAETYNGQNGTLPTAVTHGQTTAYGNTKHTKWDGCTFDFFQSSWGAGDINQSVDTKHANPASLMIERIPEPSSGGFPTAVLDCTASSQGTDGFYPDTEKAVKFAAPRRLDTPAYTWSAGTPNELDINQEGFYQFSFHFRYKISYGMDENAGSVVRVYKNGTPWNTDGPGEIRPVSAQINRRAKTLCYDDTGGTGSGYGLQRLDKFGTANMTTLIKLQPGDTIKFTIEREDENSVASSIIVNDARAELSVIQIAAGSQPDGFAVFRGGKPTSARYDSGITGGQTGTGPTGSAVVATEFSTHRQTTYDNETYAIDNAWVTETADSAYFALLSGGRIRSKQAGFLFMSYTQGATIHPGAVSPYTGSLGSTYGSPRANTSNEYVYGNGFSEVTSTSGNHTGHDFGTYGRDTTLGGSGDPHTRDWFSGSQVWILKNPNQGSSTSASPFENIVGSSLQMGLSHYATSGGASSTPMNRKHLFAGHIQIAHDAERNATWDGTVKPFEANQQFVIHCSMFAQGQTSSLKGGASSPSSTNNWNYFPGTMHRTRLDAGANEIEIVRFYVRNLYGFSVLSGDLTPSDDPVVGGGIQRVVDVEGDIAPATGADGVRTGGQIAFTRSIDAARVYAEPAATGGDLQRATNTTETALSPDGTPQLGGLISWVNDQIGSANLQPEVSPFPVVADGLLIHQFEAQNLQADFPVMDDQTEFNDAFTRIMQEQAGGVVLLPELPDLGWTGAHALQRWLQGDWEIDPAPAFTIGTDNLNDIIHQRTGADTLEPDDVALAGLFNVYLQASAHPEAADAVVGPVGQNLALEVVKEGAGEIQPRPCAVGPQAQDASLEVVRQVDGRFTHADLLATIGPAGQNLSIELVSQIDAELQAAPPTLPAYDVFLKTTVAQLVELSASAALIGPVTQDGAFERTIRLGDVDGDVHADEATIGGQLDVYLTADAELQADVVVVGGGIEIVAHEIDAELQADEATIGPVGQNLTLDTVHQRLDAATFQAEVALIGPVGQDASLEIVRISIADGIDCGPATIGPAGQNLSLDLVSQIDEELQADVAVVGPVTQDGALEVIRDVGDVDGDVHADEATIGPVGQNLSIELVSQIDAELQAAPPTLPTYDVFFKTTMFTSFSLQADEPTIGGEVRAYHEVEDAELQAGQPTTSAPTTLWHIALDVLLAPEAPTIGGEVQYRHATSVVLSPDPATVGPVTQDGALEVIRDVGDVDGDVHAGAATVGPVGQDLSLERLIQFTSSSLQAPEPALGGLVQYVHETNAVGLQAAPSTTSAPTTLWHTADDVQLAPASATIGPVGQDGALELVREVEDGAIAAGVAECGPASTDGAFEVIRQAEGTLAPAPGEYIDGYIQTRDEVTCEAELQAAPATIGPVTQDGALELIHIVGEVDGDVHADAATIGPVGQDGALELVHQALLVTLEPDPATLSGQGQLAVSLEGTLTVPDSTQTGGPATVGDIDRVVFFTGTPNLQATAALITGIAGTVLAPSINYNITLPSQNYVVYGVFD